MKQKHILIGLGIVAAGVTAYYFYKKRKSNNFSNLMLGGTSSAKKCPDGYIWSKSMIPHQCVFCGTSCDEFKKNKN